MFRHLDRGQVRGRQRAGGVRRNEHAGGAAWGQERSGQLGREDARRVSREEGRRVVAHDTGQRGQYERRRRSVADTQKATTGQR